MYFFWKCSPGVIHFKTKKIHWNNEIKGDFIMNQCQHGMILLPQEVPLLSLLTCMYYYQICTHKDKENSLRPHLRAWHQKRPSKFIVLCMVQQAGRQVVLDASTHTQGSIARCSSGDDWSMFEQLWVAPSSLLAMFCACTAGVVTNTSPPLNEDSSSALDAWERNVAGHYTICHARHVD